MLRNYQELTNYIDILEMPLDNNQTESLMRDLVMGKKSYLLSRTLAMLCVEAHKLNAKG